MHALWPLRGAGEGLSAEAEWTERGKGWPLVAALPLPGQPFSTECVRNTVARIRCDAPKVLASILGMIPEAGDHDSTFRILDGRTEPTRTNRTEANGKLTGVEPKGRAAVPQIAAMNSCMHSGRCVGWGGLPAEAEWTERRKGWPTLAAPSLSGQPRLDRMRHKHRSAVLCDVPNNWLPSCEESLGSAIMTPHV